MRSPASSTAIRSPAAPRWPPWAPARGPARQGPDPAAPGDRQLGHCRGPRDRDTELRRPDLRAPPERRSGNPGMDLASDDRQRRRSCPVPDDRSPHPRRLRPFPGRGSRHPAFRARGRGRDRQALNRLRTTLLYSAGWNGQRRSDAASWNPWLPTAALNSSSDVQWAMFTKRNCASCSDWCSAVSMCAGNVLR